MTKPNFTQNIIALVWDFDKTLIPYYMQKPLFEEYQIDEKSFWNEVNKLPSLYAEHGISLSSDTAYLNHILTYVREGKFKALSNAKLRELGARLEFFPGLPEFFHKTKDLIEANEIYQKFDIKIEHYVVSTGLTEMIRGSSISKFIKGIWGCEFIEVPYVPSANGLLAKADQNTEITSIAYLIDNTTKTRALFEINKGVNIHPEDISVNQTMSETDRRVPFINMIYIADGPSDIPAFSVARKNQAKTFAVYNKDNILSFKQTKQLLEDNRVDMFGEADYREGTTTYLWLMEHITSIADRIVMQRKLKLREAKDSIPVHLN